MNEESPRGADFAGRLHTGFRLNPVKQRFNGLVNLDTAEEDKRSAASRGGCPGIFRTGVKTVNGSEVQRDR
ncbi:protein of unknown function [Methylocaldum szegediense]|uniref:Uncharacterized protein n=1 Tax=Methylocaldum szegediense TaxID=73780 RepID=A0ABM9I7D9_9GAMM|nr:protein of unknown function [Methylocaldum szegediense]